MGRRCSICTHPNRDRIDQELADGAKYRDVARRHTITLAAVGRHADRHLPLHLARAVDGRRGRVR